MLKVGDILWEFTKDDFNVYEIATIYHEYRLNLIYLCIDVNVLIGNLNIRGIYLDCSQDYSKLGRCFGKYYTTNEQVAVNYIKTHFNETDNQRNLQQDASK